jgi:putative transcriptional regulator
MNADKIKTHSLYCFCFISALIGVYLRLILASLIAPLALLLAAPHQALAAESAANAIFLVAKPGLADPNFRETVVLVTHPGQGGPWGVIINRPLRQPLSEVFPDHGSLKGRKDVLFFGGPVARDGLVFLVRSRKPPPRSVPLLRDVYFTGDADWIDGQLKRPDPTRGLRVYSGYAGWASGQLQLEIARGGWHLQPADAATVFDKDPARIWPELVERASTKRTSLSIRHASSKRSGVVGAQRERGGRDVFFQMGD